MSSYTMMPPDKTGKRFLTLRAEEERFPVHPALTMCYNTQNSFIVQKRRTTVTRTKQRPWIPLLIAALCLIIAGCAGTGRYANAPRISLADIRVQEIRTLESAFQIGLRVINPNEIPLEISGVECELKLDGRGFATGVAGEHHEIPAYGSAVVPVTVYASIPDMVASAIAFAQGAKGDDGRPEPLRYELTGHVRLGGKSLLRRTLPFQSKGELSLDGMR